MKKILFSMLICVLSNGILYAQDSNKKLLETLVEKNILTKDEATAILKESKEDSKDEVKPESSFNESVNKIRDAFNSPYMKFGGYGLLWYKYDQYKDTHSSFKARVIYLSMEGKLTNTLSYSLLYEIVDPTLTEFYLQWTPAKFANFKVGQFKLPFTLENQIALSNLETTEFTRSISSLAGMTDDVLKLQNGKNNTGRDIGVQVAGSLFNIGDHDLIQYSAGIFQGAGIVSSAYNNSRSFAGTLLLQPIKNFRVGVGANYGEATYEDVNSGIKAGDHVRNRWAISSDYKSDRLSARAEWLHGNDAGIKREGLYGIVNYFFIPKKLGALVNVDYYNSNKDIHREVTDYTAGVNYYFYENCRVQLNYTYSDYSRKWDARSGNTVEAQLQIVF